MRTNIYVDGFNLFYGCLKGTPHKWLDLDALCRGLLPDHDIHRIRYFTARVQARDDDPYAPDRQDHYLRALNTIPHLFIHYGRFQMKRARMRLVCPPVGGPRTVEVFKTEEKGSDVNLATRLLLDIVQGDCETAVVISNDADLAMPVHAARHELGCRVGVANPYPFNKRAYDLMAADPTFLKQINVSLLRRCQFPDQLRDAQGKIARPREW